jgi:hypothetical protein
VQSRAERGSPRGDGLARATVGRASPLVLGRRRGSFGRFEDGEGVGNLGAVDGDVDPVAVAGGESERLGVEVVDPGGDGRVVPELVGAAARLARVGVACDRVAPDAGAAGEFGDGDRDRLRPPSKSRSPQEKEKPDSSRPFSSGPGRYRISLLIGDFPLSVPAP